MPTGKGPLRIAIEDFIETFNVGEKIRGWFQTWLERLENEAIDAYADFVNTTGISDHIPNQIKPATLRAMTKHQVALIAILLPLLWQIAQQFVDLFIQPFMRPLNYIAEGIAHTKHADVSTIMQALRKRPDLSGELRSILATSGLDDISIQGIDSLIDQYLTATEYQALKLRKVYSDNQVTEKLTKMGYQADDIQAFNELIKVIPGVQDLIYLQVKEAFNDSASQRFHHDEGDISQVTQWAEKQGLSQDWVRRYWRAHWQLPSPQQVFEMLQRLRPGTTNNPVTIDDVKEYLQMADYSPFWRERLTEISYLPFTRVDVRRMYKTRTLDENGVKQAYLDAGYDEKRAQALTEFTIAYEAEEETGIVRSSVISAYSDGMIDRSKASTMLKSGGYDDISIAFYLDSVDFDQQQQTNKIILNSIKAKYINGDLDETSVNNEINRLNLPAERITALLDQWTIQRDNQIQQPTQSQVEKFVELGIATIDDYKRISKLRGYTDESIEWNIKRIQIELQAQAAKNAADAAKEMERVLKDKDNSQYQVDKADIELAIAQAKEQITDIDIALQSETDPATIEELSQNKTDLKSFIASMNTAKAQLKYDFQLDKERLGTENG